MTAAIRTALAALVLAGVLIGSAAFAQLASALAQLRRAWFFQSRRSVSLVRLRGQLSATRIFRGAQRNSAVVRRVVGLAGWSATIRAKTRWRCGWPTGRSHFGAVRHRSTVVDHDSCVCGLLVASLMYAIGARMTRERFADIDPMVVACGSMIGALLPTSSFFGLLLLQPLCRPLVWCRIIDFGVLCTGLGFCDLLLADSRHWC